MSQNQFQQLYRFFPDDFYAHVSPERLNNAQLIHHNQTLCEQIGIDLTETEILQMTSGEIFPEGLEPLAQKYTGHQFGYYNPDLGDGRGVLLGQVTDSDGNYWDLHLKGSGQTPYSRRGDGRAVLRSAVREYLIGEALHGLGVPTTRCMSLCRNDEWVRREQLEPRASYIRVAKTHIRFGHFEWLAQKADYDGIQQMADYVIKTVYPELQDVEEVQQRYAALLKTITGKTAEMIAAWQVVGFCHGVMNTDNMSVAGETFDFGPYSFLDDCKIHYICNHSDTEGRYAYSQQPNVGLWNCQVLATTFSHFISQEQTQEAIDHYINTFNRSYLQKMGYRFGFTNAPEQDKLFIADTLILMDQSDIDFHYFFTLLGDFIKGEQAAFLGLGGTSKAWQLWQDKYLQRMQDEDLSESQIIMAKHNPKLVLRNYIGQEIIKQVESGNFKVIEQWIQWLAAPFANFQTDFNALEHRYLEPPQSEAKGIALSCSS